VYVNKKHVLGACKSRSWAKIEDTILDYLDWKEEREREKKKRLLEDWNACLWISLD
jgi:hypothetical protein